MDAKGVVVPKEHSRLRASSSSAAARRRRRRALASAEGDMLSEFYLSAAGGGDFGAMWRRDWREFARLFYDELRRARARMASKAEL